MGPFNMTNSMNEPALYWAPLHLRIAVTPTGIVLLDLKRNRYRGLGQMTARELAVLAANWSQVSTETQPLQGLPRDRAVARAPAFIEAGLLSREPPEVAFEACRVDLTVQLASAGLQEQRATSIRPDHILNFVRAVIWAKGALRSRTLYSIACEASAVRMQNPNALDRERAIALSCVFRRLRPLAFESQDRCLFHALALLRFLAYYDSHPTWVIGVCARPWAAHSWLQLDNCVLDGSPEEICRFTPILAI
jgi:hypothetical protein